MKMTNKNLLPALMALTAATGVFTACEKSEVAASETTTTGTIAVAASLSASAAAVPTDSVYVVQDCGPRGRRDSVAAADLPAAATAYLAASYAGYTFHQAYVVKNSTGATTGYVAIVYYNDKPVALAFDSAGNFVQVLEQREKGDLKGGGHHRGGRFEHRDGGQRDTVALAALPAAVTSYFAANYPADTLVKAFRNRDSSTTVLSVNNGAYATVFNAAGSFVQRKAMHTRTGKGQPVELSALPSVAANYLAQTYPNYVFKKAFSLTHNGTLRGFVVVIDANNTQYAVEFNATGQFVSARPIR